MAQYEHLPIYKKAYDLLLCFEKIVRGFSRYHKYTHGTALREKAVAKIRLAGALFCGILTESHPAG